MTFSRHLEVEGVFNLRDVGQYATDDGRTTRPGRLFRCGALHDLPSLVHLDIHTVIDLRSDNEITRDAIACGPIREHEGTRRISRPLIPTDVDGLGVTAYLDSLVGPGISARRYAKYLEIAGDNVRFVIEQFGQPDAFPGLVHCTAGKDRTGVIIALLLDIVGVPHETIVEDYDLTNLATPRLVEHMRKIYKTDFQPSESDLAALGAPREAMVGLLAILKQEHDGARAYLSKLGVNDGVFATIEHALLTR